MESLIESRLAELERRIAALETSISTPLDDVSTALHDDTAHAISFHGGATVSAGEVEYEWHRPAEFLVGDAFSSSLLRVAALAHPVRHAIMQRLLSADTSVQELVELGVVSSTGTAYHHISALQAAGWIHKKDGVFSIPPARIVPLLVIVAAGEDH